MIAIFYSGNLFYSTDAVLSLGLACLGCRAFVCTHFPLRRKQYRPRRGLRRGCNKYGQYNTVLSKVNRSMNYSIIYVLKRPSNNFSKSFNISPRPIARPFVTGVWDVYCPLPHSAESRKLKTFKLLFKLLGLNESSNQAT